MTQHSSAELEPGDPGLPDVPLSERPLTADDQNTVISSGNDTGVETDPNTELTATAQEIRDRLFSTDPDKNSERGLKIGHFEVEERIGAGGMGAVFRAVDTELSRYVALKVLHPSIAADPALVARFRNEARACAQLNHDNLARVFFSGEQHGVHYIAYEFADGLTIKDLISQRGRLSVEETVNYAIQSTLALSHVDAAGIVHRDIKPSNIILTHQGRVKVVDLGLARRETTDSIGDLTVAGTTLGTFDYISPEQARDPRTADIRSDIYSLGCTIYHMLTGQPPYPEGTAVQKLLDHQGKPPPDPRSLAPGVPDEMADIVQQMMNTDPEKRYQDPGQLLADLLSLATQLGLRSVPAEGIVWRRVSVTKARELSGPLFITGAVLALCITALVMHFSPGRSPADEGEVRDLLVSMVPGGLARQSAAAASDGSASAESGGGEGESSAEQLPPPPDPVVDSDRPFVVVRTDRSEESFGTLTAAWDAVRSGDRIELDFDGPMPSPTGTLSRLRSGAVQQVTLRAASGRHPILHLADVDQQSGAEQFFDLRNNLNLTLIGIDLVATIPEDAGSEWAIFSLVGPNQLLLRDCTVEVKNSARTEAAVIRLQSSTVEFNSDFETSLRLENTAVKGTCDLLTVQAQTACAVTIHDSVLALDGSLLSHLGTTASLTDSTLGAGYVTCDLNHVTTLCSQPLIRIRDSEVLTGDSPERQLPTLTIDALSSVFASLSADGTLVLSEGNAAIMDMQELLTWRGKDNLYHQLDVCWDLRSERLGSVPEQMTFEQWVQYWENSISGQADNAEQTTIAPWVTPDAIDGLNRSEINTLAVSQLEIDPRLFFGNSTPVYQRDRNGRVPGASVQDVPEFPAAARTLMLNEESPVPPPESVSESPSTEQ